MTTLHPTPSRKRVPLWVIVVSAILLGALLVGAGLLLLNGGQDEAPTAQTTPSCTPTAGTPTATPTGKITVNVYNATDRAGLARETADELKLRSFEVDEVANDPKKATVEGTAVVRYVGSETQARWVAAQVSGATLQKVSAAGRTGAKFDLVIGEDYSSLATTTDAKANFVAGAPRPSC